MVSYTTISLTLYAIAHATRSAVVSAIAIPTLWGVLTSFSCAVLIDPTAYARLRRKRGWSTLTFWSGYVVLHVLPVCLPPPCATVEWHHGALAAALHVAWWVAVTRGTMDLGEIYVAAPPRLWYACLATVVLTDAVVIPLAHAHVKLGGPFFSTL